MITKSAVQNGKIRPFIVEFCKENFDYDFYFTENNCRLYITDEASLKQLFKNTEHIYVSHDDRGELEGFILSWKSIGGGTKRNYLKVNARNEKIAKDLLTCLLWNTNNDYYVKIRKDSSFMRAFKQKGFRFIHGRGCQVLLFRKNRIDKTKKVETKREKE